MASYLSNGGVHVDRPLSNFAIKAFDGGPDGFVGPQIMPRVNVDKQSNTFYVFDPAVYMRVENTRRSRGVPANRGEWQVSSDTYFADNYAFGTSIPFEDLANQDEAIQLRQNSTRYVTDMLNRDRENRIANLVTSIDNLGSGTSLSGSDKWSDQAGSDPISDVQTGHAFIEDRTGLQANAAVMDKDTHRTLRFHPAIREFMKYTGEGPVPDSMLAQVFEVDSIMVARGLKNVAKEGASRSMNNIWGNNFLLARIEQNPGLQAQSFGASFMWRPAEFPAPMAVERFNDPEPSKKSERIETQLFVDEKVVASDLAYLISSTL